MCCCRNHHILRPVRQQQGRTPRDASNIISRPYRHAARGRRGGRGSLPSRSPAAAWRVRRGGRVLCHLRLHRQPVCEPYGRGLVPGFRGPVLCPPAAAHRAGAGGVPGGSDAADGDVHPVCLAQRHQPAHGAGGVLRVQQPCAALDRFGLFLAALGVQQLHPHLVAGGGGAILPGLSVPVLLLVARAALAGHGAVRAGGGGLVCVGGDGCGAGAGVFPAAVPVLGAGGRGPAVPAGRAPCADPPCAAGGVAVAGHAGRGAGHRIAGQHAVPRCGAAGAGHAGGDPGLPGVARGGLATARLCAPGAHLSRPHLLFALPVALAGVRAVPLDRGAGGGGADGRGRGGERGGCGTVVSLGGDACAPVADDGAAAAPLGGGGRGGGAAGGVGRGLWHLGLAAGGFPFDGQSQRG